MSFKLNGHDLSYWDDAADGWVLPDGNFHVYVGDSSALDNLPLQGAFHVTQTVGARYLTVSAPDTVDAGRTATVTATLVNDGDYAMPQAQFTLKAPAGWTVSNPRPVSIAAGQTVTESFKVTAPSSAAPGTRTLTVTVTPGNGTPVAEGSTTIVVPYASVEAAYNNIGISDNSNESAANYDGVGDSFSAQALAAGTPNALTPGGMVTIGGTTFTWPNVPAGTPDNVVTGGQTVDLSGSGTDLGFLGSSQNGTASGIVTIHYTDGSSQSFNLNMADWYANAAAVGNELVTTTSSWNFQSNPLGAHPVSVYFASAAAGAGQDGLLGDAAGAERRRRHHRDAHLRDGDWQRHPDDGRAVLVARRRLRQRRHQRQLRSVGRQLRRHRRELLGSRRSPPARQRR